MDETGIPSFRFRVPAYFQVRAVSFRECIFVGHGEKDQGITPKPQEKCSNKNPILELYNWCEFVRDLERTGVSKIPFVILGVWYIYLHLPPKLPKCR